MSVSSSFNGDAFQTNESARQITPRCLKMLDRQVYDELLAVSLDRCRGDRDTSSSDALLKVSLALSRSLDRRQDIAQQQMSNNELRLYQTRMNDLAGSGGLDQRSVSIGRYKTERCRPFEETGQCKYGDKCQFAHGDHELRMLSRHPKYKTELCRTFHTVGFCPYGPRCHFVHRSEASAHANFAEHQLRNESVQLSRMRCTSESQLFCSNSSSSNSPIYVSSEIGAITLAAARNAITRLLNENYGGALHFARGSNLNGAVNEGGYDGERVQHLGQHQLPRGCRSTSKDGDDSLIAQLLNQLRLDGASLSPGGGLSTLYDAGTSHLLPTSYPMFDVPFGSVNGHCGVLQ